MFVTYFLLFRLVSTLITLLIPNMNGKKHIVQIGSLVVELNVHEGNGCQGCYPVKKRRFKICIRNEFILCDSRSARFAFMFLQNK